MHQNFTHTDIVDNYLKGKLSEGERQAFEEKLRQDPLLANEISLQKDIYVALGDTRKAALKHRLNQLAVDHSPWAPWQGFKTAAVVSTLLMVGAGAYYYSKDTPATLPAKQQITYPQAYTLNRVPVPTIVPKKTPATVEGAVEQNRASVRPAAPSAKVVIPTIVRPEVVSEFGEDTPAIDYSDFKAPDKKTLQKPSYQNESVAIELLSDSEYDFHYQFYDDKLYLHGDFYGMPYKIIALNTEVDKKLFLEFDEAYYRIGEHRKVVPLGKIEDSTLVKSLRALGQVD